SRVFNVSIDGQPALMNFDIVQETGDQRGTMRSFNITSDGTVNIDTTHVVENPQINAVEILRTDVAPTDPTNSLSSVFLKADGTTLCGLRSDAAANISWGSMRGAFKVGDLLYYGMTDGLLHRRAFDGQTFGADEVVNPYNDPKWKD